MYTGMGIVRAVPGPVFSYASFTGGMALKDMGTEMQVAGLYYWHNWYFSAECLTCSFLFSYLE